jgi:hypothetical protein
MRNKDELIAEMKLLKQKVEVSIEKRMTSMEKQIKDNEKHIKNIHNELNFRGA